MSACLVLWPGEIAYRWVGAWLMVQDSGSWAAPSWTHILITDQRLLCCFDDGRLLSLSWSEVAGLQIVLDQQRLLLGGANQSPTTFSGTGTAAIAVAAVAMLYGPSALLSHPALSPLRCESPPTGPADGSR